MNQSGLLIEDYQAQQSVPCQKKKNKHFFLADVALLRGRVPDEGGHFASLGFLVFL